MAVGVPQSRHTDIFPCVYRHWSYYAPSRALLLVFGYQPVLHGLVHPLLHRFLFDVSISHVTTSGNDHFWRIGRLYVS